MVLSTTSGMPWAWAILAIASMSATIPSGFEALSMKSARVRSSMALAKLSGSRGSTYFTPQLNWGKVCFIWLIDPP